MWRNPGFAVVVAETADGRIPLAVLAGRKTVVVVVQQNEATAHCSMVVPANRTVVPVGTSESVVPPWVSNYSCQVPNFRLAFVAVAAVVVNYRNSVQIVVVVTSYAYLGPRNLAGKAKQVFVAADRMAVVVVALRPIGASSCSYLSPMNLVLGIVMGVIVGDTKESQHSVDASLTCHFPIV